MISAKQFSKYGADPSAFRADLVVDVSGTAKRFGDIQDGWQRDDFAAIDPGLMACNGRASLKTKQKMRAYLERGRGSSKTTDLAVMVTWALAFAQRPIKGYGFASDKDQARLLRDACQTVIRLNPWLGEILQVETHRIVNVAPKHPGEGASLIIESSDVGSSYGILPDLIIVDELTHWEGDGSLWHSLISSAAKRENCFLCVISNAGFCDSWQWQVREAARTDEGWIFSRLDGCKASWFTQERLAEQSRMLPAIAFARLWGNVWSTGGGDALTQADINAAFIQGIAPQCGREYGWVYVAGLDLGLKRDGSAVAILAVPDGRYGKIRLAEHRLWRPTPGKKVDLNEIERYLIDADNRYGIAQVNFDPWNAELLASRLESSTMRRRRNQQRRAWAKAWMKETPPTASNLREQATLIIESFADRRLELYECEPLKRDLEKLRVEEKSYGIRLTSPRDGEGHGDLFSAFSLAMLVGHELSAKRPTMAGIMTANDSTMDAEDFIESRLSHMKELAEGGADYSGTEALKKAMRTVGR